jgi:putative membrane protein
MMGGFGMGFGWIFGILLIGLVVWAVIRVAGNNANRTEDHRQISSENSPMDILKKRYARGEISKEEFEEMKKNLNS